MNQQPQHFYEFGPFRLDAVERLLLREAEPLPLTPKSFELLLALVERHGHIVEKQELMQAVWPDTFVEETNLTKNIFILRQALGEPDDGGRYIETVPKRGYRFVAQVREVREKSEELAVTEPVHSPTAIAAEPETNAQTTPPGGYQQPAAIAPTSIRPALWRLLAVALGVLLTAAAIIGLTRRGEERVVQIKSLAVLPFKPLVANNRDEALELGMANTLITKLGNLRQLIVRPTSAVRKYTALDQDPLAAGREQRVDAVLESSMHLSGEKIRVTAILLDVRDGSLLWTYECTEYCTDIFAAQDAVAQKVAKALALKLTNEEGKGIAKRYTDNLEVYQLYAKGNYFRLKYTQEGLRQGIEYFKQAIEKDKSYAPAYTAIAQSYAVLMFRDWIPLHEGMPLNKAAAVKAIELDYSLADAHMALGVYKQYYEWDWAGAEQELNRAVELNPNNSEAWQFYAHYLYDVGRFDECIAARRRAVELDPLWSEANADLGLALAYNRQYREAIEQLRKTIILDPNYARAHLYLGMALEQEGRNEEAIAEYLKGQSLSGAPSEVVIAMRKAYQESGMRGYRQKTLEYYLQSPPVNAVSVARLYGRLGDKDQTLAWLEKAYEERVPAVVHINSSPEFEFLRSDPRYAALIRRIGLAP